MKRTTKTTIRTFLIIVFFSSCVNDVKTGIPMFSYNIKESKKDKLFINEYSISKTRFNINKTTYKILEAWSENAWAYKNANEEKYKLKYNNFLIRFNQNHIDKILSKGGYGLTNEKIFFRLTEEEMKKDTIKLYFYIKKDTIPIAFTRIKG